MKPNRLIRRGIFWGSVGIAGGALVVTARHILTTPQPLESALAGEGRIDLHDGGATYYDVAGPEGAEPLVLLHDFYPGASNCAFRRIFPRLAASYRVYAPDWLGFGMSERPALAYTGEFYAHLLAGFLHDTVGKPAIVVAHGLAGNIAARAASDEPELFARLVLVAPHPLAGTEPGPTIAQSLMRMAQRAALGLVPYAALATRPALRWQARRRAARPGEGAATDDALDHAYASAHQFGGQHALLAWLTGELDLPIQNAFALLEPPVLVIGGERDPRQPRGLLEHLALLNPNAQLLTIADAGEAVYEDQPDAFLDRVETWLRSPRMRQTVQPQIQWRGPGLEGAPVSEQFGEPHGVVTPAPGLEALAGLVEQAPEAVPLHEVAGAPEVPNGPDGAAAAPDQAPEEPMVVILGAADEALDAPRAPGVGEAAVPEAPEQAAWPEQAADAAAQTARALAEAEERARSEAQRLDEAIRAAGPEDAATSHEAAPRQPSRASGSAPSDADATDRPRRSNASRGKANTRANGAADAPGSVTPPTTQPLHQ
jgi:pimeloyl-ACP methyl ester carboxylesterase